MEHQGIRKPEQVIVRRKEMQEWPVAKRILALPLLIVIAPFALGMVMFNDLKRSKRSKIFLLMIIPSALLLFPFHFVMPQRVGRLTRRVLAPARKRLALEEVQHEQDMLEPASI